MIGAGHCPARHLTFSGDLDTNKVFTSAAADILISKHLRQTQFFADLLSQESVLQLELLSLATLHITDVPRICRDIKKECPGVSRRHQECPRLLDTEQSLLVLLQNPPEQTEAAQETPAGLRNVQCVTYCCGKIIINELVK